ncbi:MAG: hypothetical protein ACE5JN_02880 [Candidatus Methylomirabilia bacterium]
MDVFEAKNRISKAMVESIFRRARYQVSQYRRELPSFRFGRNEFSPDLEVRLEGEDPPKEFRLAVKYRPHIDQFLAVESQRGERSAFQMARRHWPDLCFIFVTDRPEPGRSCFQAFPLWLYDPSTPCRSIDLVEVKEAGIFPHNVRDHEELARRIFAALSGV